MAVPYPWSALFQRHRGLLFETAILIKLSKNMLGNHFWDVFLAIENPEFAPFKVCNFGGKRDNIIDQEGTLRIIQVVIVAAFLHRIIVILCQLDVLNIMNNIISSHKSIHKYS